ncbi:MAG: CHAT domain-containing tetratricopeptide repeat protein [Candidatus Zixiibacteriota bacterium]
MARWFVLSALILASIILRDSARCQSWRDLISTADSLDEMDHADSAIKIGRLALEKAEEEFGPEDTNVASVLHRLGVYKNSQYFVYGYDEIVSWLERAQAIRERAYGKQHQEVADVLSTLAIFYQKFHFYDKSDPLLKRALIIYEKTLGKEHPKTGQILWNLGISYWRQNNYTESETFFRRSLDVTQEALGSKHADVAQRMIFVGMICDLQGKYAQAESFYLQSLAIATDALGPNHQNVADILSQLGVLCEHQGKYAEAELHYQRSLDILENTLGSDDPKAATTMVNLGNIYVRQDRYSDAEPLFSKSLDIQEEALGSVHPEVAACQEALGVIYAHQGKYAEAESLYQQCLYINNLILAPGNPTVARNLRNLGDAYLIQGKYIQADSCYKQSFNIFERALGTDHPDVAQSLSSLATLYMHQGKFTEAEPLLRRALNTQEKALGTEHPSVATTLENMALIYGSLGQADKSLECYNRLQQSRQHFIEYAFSYASEEQKMRYVEKYPLMEHSLISFAVMTDSDDSKRSALEMILKGKGAVIDAVSVERQIAYCSYDDKIQEKVEKHTGVCGEISTLTLAGANELDPEIYRDRLRALYCKKDSLEAELSQSCAEFQDELEARRFTVTDVADVLSADAVLWEYVRYEPFDFEKGGGVKERIHHPRYAAFTLDHNGYTTLTDLGDAGEIDNLISQARKLIYRARGEVYSALADESEKRLGTVTSRLYDILFAPLKLRLGAKTRIFISPDGQLSLLPFEILLCPDGNYVIEEFQISYVSSGRDLLRFEWNQACSELVYVLADPDFSLSTEALAEHIPEVLKKSGSHSIAREPSRGVSGCLNSQFTPLPYSREEAESVAMTLGRRAQSKIEFYHSIEAIEEILKSMPAAPRVLHLATHGYFCEDTELDAITMVENPLLRSGLALAGANRVVSGVADDGPHAEDGVLTAFEVSGLNLVGTELVTLSACESGLGQVKNGEGVYGLRRAFQHAGARTIVMSLWKVPDKETCELMELFYRAWLSGESKSVALRKAALSLMSERRRSKGSAHPLFWGGFVLVGDPE